MNVNSPEPEDSDSAMKDAPQKLGNLPESEDKPADEKDDADDATDNPDDVRDGSAQDGSQPLAGA